VYRSPQLKTPRECADGELREFERMVRQGFHGSDDTLPTRIADAKCLAFQRAVDGTLVAIAGLKQLGEEYTEGVFAKAEAGMRPAYCDVELGWVFVLPRHQGNRIASRLCTELLERSPSPGVFATTQPDNVPMIRILLALGFVQIGRPFPRRANELALFVRSQPSQEGAQSLL